LPEFKSWTHAKDVAEKAAAAIVKKVREWVENEELDLVLSEFEQLVANCQFLPTTDRAVELAQRRKILGQPPTSPDKHTIGDELTWETLLAGVQGDLVIVSRDRTFTQNQAILKREFGSLPEGRLVRTTGKLSDAFDFLGKPSERIKVAEDEVAKARYADYERMAAATNHTRCPRCGGELDETGFDGSGGDEAWWLYCTRCGLELFPNRPT
jgi:hypothetical protein